MPPILVIDDDAAIRKMTRLVLEDDGYIVLEASDGAAALNVLRASHQPLVALLDLAMPGTAGEAVLQIVRDEPELHHHVYVVVTARAASQFTSDVRDLIAAVCLEVIEKPFTINHMVEVVRRAAGAAQGHPSG